jgi:hypothetical protein
MSGFLIGDGISEMIGAQNWSWIGAKLSFTAASHESV